MEQNPQSGTNIVIQTQPPPYVPTTTQVVISTQPTQRAWSHDLFDCTDDICDCLYANYCRLCYAVELGKMHNESCCTIFCWGDVALIPIRTKIRTERNIAGTVCNDIMTVWCCNTCALIQMKKETLENPVNQITTVITKQ